MLHSIRHIHNFIKELIENMYTAIFGLLLSLICKLVTSDDDGLHPLSDAFIDQINKQAKWTAGRNFHPDTPMSYIKQLMGANLHHPGMKNLPKVKHDMDLIKSLPASFDPRDKWPNCPSLREIRDQGSCGSCWALAAVAAMTDRVCTYSNGTKNFHFSAEDLITCAGHDNGCRGGSPVLAWERWVYVGLVSGGRHDSREGCKPYSIPPCNHYGGNRNCTQTESTPPCVTKCEDGYDVPYELDKQRGKRCYSLEDEDNMKAELFKHGPIEVVIRVYQDFLHYKTGVYEHVKHRLIGLHAVKVLGWGEDGGKKYWLVANSWNPHWGDKGYIKIKRGVNECGIEEDVIAGDPDD